MIITGSSPVLAAFATIAQSGQSVSFVTRWSGVQISLVAHAGVTQSGRVSSFQVGGQGFKSPHPLRGR